MGQLEGKIAVVTGVSRNVGRGITTVLREEAVTVCVTRRSGREAGSTPISPSTILSAGTIEKTAELVTTSAGSRRPIYPAVRPPVW